mmetsp:Transcript_32092/g.84035  ORF Transcript_32092/g.84035 Transcript_32092/m.84035 type:complete len:200 (+) Transcript_32092:1388-1987(+)
MGSTDGTSTESSPLEFESSSECGMPSSRRVVSAGRSLVTKRSAWSTENRRTRLPTCRAWNVSLRRGSETAYRSPWSIASGARRSAASSKRAHASTCDRCSTLVISVASECKYEPSGACSRSSNTSSCASTSLAVVVPVPAAAVAVAVGTAAAAVAVDAAAHAAAFSAIAASRSVASDATSGGDPSTSTSRSCMSTGGVA